MLLLLTLLSVSCKPKESHTDPFYLKPAHKSVGSPWVRVASSAQSRSDDQLLPNAPPPETARWKRRVPRARANQRVVCKVFLFAQSSLNLIALAFAVSIVGYGEASLGRVYG